MFARNGATTIHDLDNFQAFTSFLEKYLEIDIKFICVEYRKPLLLIFNRFLNIANILFFF